ncbi:MAG: hypothetical protein HY722_11970 [Planctomycetes bacterium]|nr:hypothetical protein [Planctomycetota bacterium]
MASRGLHASASLLFLLAACGPAERLAGLDRRRGAGAAPAKAPATAATTAASTGAGTVPPRGPLAERARRFEEAMAAHHAPDGLVLDLRLDATGGVAGYDGYGDAAIWTGTWAGVEALRWRATGDPDALAAMERALWALHHLHAITGVPGLITRGFGEPRFLSGGLPGQGPYARWNYETGDLSRDQYSGWFYGVGLAWEVIADPALRAALREDARAIAYNLMMNDLALRGSFAGAPFHHFDLDPDNLFADEITPQAWATVDDFPLNVLARSVPYSPALAQRLLTLRGPPVRGGEALRALMFFTVAEHVTSDPAIAAYRRHVLLGSKDLLGHAERNLTLFEDAVRGRNLPAVRAALAGLADVLAQLLDFWLQARGQHAAVRALAGPLAQGLSRWLGDVALRLVAWLNDPTRQAERDAVLADLRLLADVLDLVGLPDPARTLRGLVTTYGAHLHPAGLVDLAHQMRSYVGLNLSLLALATSCHLETDPALRSAYGRMLDRVQGDVASEGNAWADAIQAGWGARPWPGAAASVRLALATYPDDRHPVVIDNSALPYVVPSPWIDRFGRGGNHAVGHFGLDRRERHRFVWQEHPRKIRGGANQPLVEVAPLGYLAAYWTARYHGILGAAD